MAWPSIASTRGAFSKTKRTPGRALLSRYSACFLPKQPCVCPRLEAPNVWADLGHLATALKSVYGSDWSSRQQT